ncbi:MAG: hypothetical protein ACOYB8_03990 [Eubacteriaceae bacterium]
MRRYRLFAITAALLLTVMTAAGCGQQKQNTEKADPAYFISELTQTRWTASLAGHSILVSFTADGTGAAQLDNADKADFTYSVADVTDDGLQANITINTTDSRYSDKVNGEYKAMFRSDKELNIKNGMLSVTLTPSEDNFQ